MRHRLLLLCSLLSVIYYLLTAAPAFAQTATSPAGRREQQIDQRRQRIEDRQVRRTDRQQQIISRMKEKLAAVIDRLTNVAARLKDHAARIRALAKGNEKVESALSEAERHIGLAETEINNVKAQLSELDGTDKPKDVAQTFRTGVQSIHSHFKDARANLVSALKALREAAKESRPTRPADTNQ